MKTNERSGWLRRCAVMSKGVISKGVISSVGFSFIIAACGGATKDTPRTGSESHFLAFCGGSCGDGLECIGQICTRPCITSASGCSDLASGAACTNQSVEPGQVAVCDVACTLPAECSALGNGFECTGGFCRKAPTGTAGAGGTGGSSGSCNPLGRYEVGKEGGYLPCCAGLNEISRGSLLEDGQGRLVCQQLPLNTYACIEGTCGDGRCEEEEKVCGCAQDCPDVPGPARDLQCSRYLDQTAPPVVHEVSITNAGAQTLYLERWGGCGDSLVSVERAGQPVNITGFTCGAASCQRIVDFGWEAPFSCANTDCAAAAPTAIAPGQTITQIVAREAAVQPLPRACVPRTDETVMDPVGCYSWVIPQPGVYDIRVRAFTDPSCNSQTCVFSDLTKQGDWFFEDHTFVLGAPVP
jgi:hypothetical protein